MYKKYFLISNPNTNPNSNPNPNPNHNRFVRLIYFYLVLLM